jgi:hypothetical protein
MLGSALPFAPTHSILLRLRLAQGRGAFRRAYEPARAANVPAHVTLVFGARAISQAELTAHVAEVARRIRPLTPP